MPCRVDRQVDGHAPGPQVVDTQDRGDDIPREVVKYQDLPYRLARFGEDWGVGGGQSAVRVVIGGLLRGVEVEDALDGRWELLLASATVATQT